uniref:KOW domain-containing protein n=1 Tax=Ascaris lumbricoides TaxID=6252 RepID=A0A0M3HYZ7_ASCLU
MTTHEGEQQPPVFPAHLSRYEVEFGKRVVIFHRGTGKQYHGLVVACNDRYVMVKISDADRNSYGVRRIQMNPHLSEVELFAQEDWHEAVRA